ncbi:MAG TPA: response regulator transcription factor, partial [Bryobacteraceae bacterium]|nr:response regulator transcription factor [Bryobacteraceae bacterium]
VIIVDDNEPFRQCLRSITESWGAEVVAEAENGQIGVDTAERVQPDLVLLDVTMPVMSGFAAAKRLRERLPLVQIIFVSQHQDRLYAKKAFESGAHGYVLKTAAATDLAAALEAIISHRTFLSPSIA